ncbi:MAG: hypothetical protein Q8900_06510 [Bacillota bacterium]|nr:hypothetical protein [Bacillota bacterium]
MAKIKLSNMERSKIQKTVEEIHKEYIDYCKIIGQRDKTIESKLRFYRFCLKDLVNLQF